MALGAFLHCAGSFTMADGNALVLAVPGSRTLGCSLAGRRAFRRDVSPCWQSWERQDVLGCSVKHGQTGEHYWGSILQQCV